MIVGDSFTWGDGVAAEQVYHRRLQEQLDQERFTRRVGNQREAVTTHCVGIAPVPDHVRISIHNPSVRQISWPLQFPPVNWPDSIHRDTVRHDGHGRQTPVAARHFIQQGLCTIDGLAQNLPAVVFQPLA